MTFAIHSFIIIKGIEILYENALLAFNWAPAPTIVLDYLQWYYGQSAGLIGRQLLVRYLGVKLVCVFNTPNSSRIAFAF